MSVRFAALGHSRFRTAGRHEYMQSLGHHGSIADRQRHMLVLDPDWQEGVLDFPAHARQLADLDHGEPPAVYCLIEPQRSVVEPIRLAFGTDASKAVAACLASLRYCLSVARYCDSGGAGNRVARSVAYLVRLCTASRGALA
jgi:hypothetical protein